MYQVKEAFYTLQGEGAQAGRASVFAVSAAAIYGVAVNRIGQQQNAPFVIPISSASMVTVAVSLLQPTHLRITLPRYGQATQAMPYRM